MWKALLVLLLVAANGFFVAAEFALVKVRLSEIRALSRTGSRTARLVQRVLIERVKPEGEENRE